MNTIALLVLILVVMRAASFIVRALDNVAKAVRELYQD